MRLEFAGELWYWRGPSPYHFVTVPDDGCAELRALAPVVSYGWGMIPVNVRIGGPCCDLAVPQGRTLRRAHQGRRPQGGGSGRGRHTDAGADDPTMR